MDFNLSEWLNLVVRWVHVFAGILWIGQTYFFTWLDGRLSAEEEAGAKTNPASNKWRGGADFSAVRPVAPRSSASVATEVGKSMCLLATWVPAKIG